MRDRHSHKAVESDAVACKERKVTAVYALMATKSAIADEEVPCLAQGLS